MTTNKEFWEDFFSTEKHTTTQWRIAFNRSEDWGTCAVGTKLFPYGRTSNGNVLSKALGTSLYDDGKRFNDLIHKRKFREARLLFYEIMWYG